MLSEALLSSAGGPLGLLVELSAVPVDDMAGGGIGPSSGVGSGLGSCGGVGVLVLGCGGEAYLDASGELQTLTDSGPGREE